LKCLITNYLIILEVIRPFKIFVNGGSMTNAKVYQGFHDDKKVEEHWFTQHTSKKYTPNFSLGVVATSLVAFCWMCDSPRTGCMRRTTICIHGANKQ